MILITGAGGKTGRAVMRALISKGEPLRALVHRSDQIQRVESLGVREVLAGDMNSPSTMDRAVQGVRAIYHICPNVSPDEVSIGQTAIAAAMNAGVYPVPYPAETRLSFVDLENVAQVAAIALTESGHAYATYELVGTPGLSQSQVADALSHQLGRPVRG